MLTCSQCGAGAYYVTEYVEDRTYRWRSRQAWQCSAFEHHNSRRERRTTPTKENTDD